MNQRGPPAFIAMISTSGNSTNGRRCATVAATRSLRRLKATTNVTRYRASGTIQSSGTAATSVDRYVVTASIRLAGMKLSAIQRDWRIDADSHSWSGSGDSARGVMANGNRGANRDEGGTQDISGGP